MIHSNNTINTTVGTTVGTTAGSSYAGEYALIDMYRQQPLSQETIKNLYQTSQGLRHYIINTEQNNIKNGIVARNTFNAVLVSKALQETVLNLYGLSIEPLKRNLAKSKLSETQGVNFLTLVMTNESERTLLMLADAGILKLNEIPNNAICSEIIETIYNHLSHRYNNNNNNYGRIAYGINQNNLSKQFGFVKSNNFIQDWLHYGYPQQNEVSEYQVNMQLINQYLNYSYLDLSHIIPHCKKNLFQTNLCGAHLENYSSKIRNVDFGCANLSDSYLSNATFENCDFDYVNLSGSVINNLNFKNCNFSYINVEGIKASNLIFNNCIQYEIFEQRQY